MDLEEWEVLSDDGFLEIHDDGGNKIFSRKYAGGGADPNSTSTSVDLNNNYFICPSPRKSYSANQLVLPVPIQFGDQDDDGKAEVKSPSNPVVGGGASMETAASFDDEQEEEEAAVSQVFFKKVKETHEFVDMKLDSPTSTGANGGGCWGVLPQIEPAVPMVQFDKESTTAGGDTGNNKIAGSEIEDEDGINNNLWKWSLHGIGAICSFGVAAATICIIILGNSSNSNSHHKNQKIRFQVYADDEKRMIKQVVVEQANSKLNEAILAVRGVPLSRRAHFTCGGYYEGL